MNLPIYIDNKIYVDYLINILGVPEANIVNIYPEQPSFFIYKENGLHFVINSPQKKLIHIDFLKGQMGWRLKRTDHVLRLHFTCFNQWVYHVVCLLYAW